MCEGGEVPKIFFLLKRVMESLVNQNKVSLMILGGWGGIENLESECTVFGVLKNTDFVVSQNSCYK